MVDKTTPASLGVNVYFIFYILYFAAGNLDTSCSVRSQQMTLVKGTHETKCYHMLPICLSDHTPNIF